MTMVTCGTCKHIRKNTGRNEWCWYYESRECKAFSLWEEYLDRYGRGWVPSSTDECETAYPDVNDVPEGTCERCGLNKTGGACGYHQKKKEPVIIVGSRYYQPPQEDGQIEQTVPFPVLVMEG